MTGEITHTYRYRRPSSLTASPEETAVSLSTSGGVSDHPYFFQGSLRQPRLAALALHALTAVVGARHHIPPAMLARIIRQADPVVTSGGGMLRFEGFSGCASVYARVDLSPDAYDGVVTGQGTTNVDFNADFRAALVQIHDGERVGLAVGDDEVTLLRGADQQVERKVDLPLRWLKSFAEVQAYQSRLEPRLEVGRVEAVKFLRALPRNPDSRMEAWIVPQAGRLHLSRKPTPEGVRITGLKRLRVLEDLAPLAPTLRVFASPASQASEWQLDFGPLRFSLTLSAETWRGFSGEGLLLETLALPGLDEPARHTRSLLRWQSELRLEELAEEGALSPTTVPAALAVLGSRGLLGYDIAKGAYFHRELPFDLDSIERLHPRLIAARELVARKKVRIVSETNELTEADVAGTDVIHRVRLTEDNARCTCVWHAKHQGERGPCKHILATRILLERTADIAS